MIKKLPHHLFFVVLSLLFTLICKGQSQNSTTQNTSSTAPSVPVESREKPTPPIKAKKPIQTPTIELKPTIYLDVMLSPELEKFLPQSIAELLQAQGLTVTTNQDDPSDMTLYVLGIQTKSHFSLSFCLSKSAQPLLLPIASALRASGNTGNAEWLTHAPLYEQPVSKLYTGANSVSELNAICREAIASYLKNQILPQD